MGERDELGVTLSLVVQEGVGIDRGPAELLSINKRRELRIATGGLLYAEVVLRGWAADRGQNVGRETALRGLHLELRDQATRAQSYGTARDEAEPMQRELARRRRLTRVWADNRQQGAGI